MPGVDVVIFHHAPSADAHPLVRLLREARSRLLDHQLELWSAAGARRVLVVPGRDATPGGATSETGFGGRLAELIREERIGRLVVMGSGAVPLLRVGDAQRLVTTAAGTGRRAATNNRYSSDVCAVSDTAPLQDLPPLPSDNALPRWLEERAGFRVRQLPGRDRLALDLDTPLDVALLTLAAGAPEKVVAWARSQDVHVPHREGLRELASDPRRELLVFGRSGSRTLRWLERNVRSRVRFLAEERGMRASSPLAIDAPDGPSEAARPPRATLGRLLVARGPEALSEVVAELADGAIIDSRVLLADRLGADESGWPADVDRFASDLLRHDEIADRWLRALTRSAADASVPILMGAHSLVGPGIRLLLGGR